MNISKEVKPLRVFCILIIYAFLGWWNTLSLVAHHQDDWHRRFREGAPKARRQIAETARKVQGSLHYISMR
ncbi:MAG: hypothetical protein NZ914_09330, partial [Gemmatales bacterium]|nr:hypothetical protein [Gemmatales bacterium]